MSSSSYTILITEGELEAVFSRIHKLHGATFGKSAGDKNRPTSAPATDVPDRNRSSTINFHTPTQNKDLQRVLDDIKDGLQGLISRTEFDRFLDELERDNGILSKRFGFRHRRILMLAEKAMSLGDSDLGSGAKAPQKEETCRMLPKSWPREELRQWILGSVSVASTAKHGGPDSRNCRWFMCERPDQVLCFARKNLPAEWADNFIFTTPVYVPKDTIGSNEDAGKRTSILGCDKKTALSMLLVDLISTVSERVDAKHLSGFKKADLPNIRSPAGQLQALVMVLDMCLKALALGRERPSPSSFDVESNRKGTNKEPLLIIVDRIDSIIGPDTDHYVKKIVLMLKEAACPVPLKKPEDTPPPVAAAPSALNRLRSFRGRKSLPADNPDVKAATAAADSVRVLLVVASEEGSTYLGKHCDIPPATTVRVLGNDKLSEGSGIVKNEQRANNRSTGFPESCLTFAGTADNDVATVKQSVTQEEEEDLWGVKPSLNAGSLVSTFSPQHLLSTVTNRNSKGIVAATTNRCVSNPEQSTQSRKSNGQQTPQVRPESQVLPIFTPLPSLGPLQPPARPSTASSSCSGRKRPVSMQLVRDHAIVPGQASTTSFVTDGPAQGTTRPSASMQNEKTKTTVVSGLSIIPMSPRADEGSLLTPLLSPAHLSPTALTAEESPLSKTLGAVARAMSLLPRWKSLAARKRSSSCPKQSNSTRAKPKPRTKVKTKKATSAANRRSRSIRLPKGRVFGGREISLPISVSTSLEMPYPAGAKLSHKQSRKGGSKEEMGKGKEVSATKPDVEKQAVVNLKDSEQGEKI